MCSTHTELMERMCPKLCNLCSKLKAFDNSTDTKIRTKVTVVYSTVVMRVGRGGTKKDCVGRGGGGNEEIHLKDKGGMGEKRWGRGERSVGIHPIGEAGIFISSTAWRCVFKAWYWPCIWMFRLALSGHIYFLPFETPTLTLCLLAPLNTWCGNACLGAQVSSKYGTWYSERVILQFMCVGCWAGVTYLLYTVLMSPNKDETAVHCCDPALSVLVMLVSRNVFHVVSALQSIVSSANACLWSVETRRSFPCAKKKKKEYDSLAWRLFSHITITRSVLFY